MWREYFLGHDLIYLNSCLGCCELIQVFCLTTCNRHAQIGQNEIWTVLTFSPETTMLLLYMDSRSTDLFWLKGETGV